MKFLYLGILFLLLYCAKNNEKNVLRMKNNDEKLNRTLPHFRNFSWIVGAVTNI